MAKVDHIQTSFAGGEFGASLFGRSDIDQYANACAILENMIVRPYGSAISTAGSKFQVEVKDSDKRTRVIPFVFNRTDAYALEMGEDYFRFHLESGVVCSTGTTPFEVAHPYSEDEIFQVQVTQLSVIFYSPVYRRHPDKPFSRIIRMEQPDDIV